MGTERMTACDPSQRQPRSSCGTKSFDRLGCIAGAGRNVSTARPPGRSGRPVQVDQPQEYPCHHRVGSGSMMMRQWRTNSGCGTVKAGRAAPMMTWEVPTGPRLIASPTQCRRRRRILFRSTALPKRFPMVKPKRSDEEPSRDSSTRARSGPDRRSSPEDSTNRNSLRCERRSITRSGGDDPFADAIARRLGRPDSTHDGETHAWWLACEYWVGTSSSRGHLVVGL